MLGEWVLKDGIFEKKELDELERVLYEVIPEFDIRQNVIYGEYDDMTEYFSIRIIKLVNEYNVPVYELTVRSGNYDNIKGDCNCEYCSEDCPLYSLTESEREEYFENEVKSWLNKPKKEIRNIDITITIEPAIIEIYNSVIGILVLKAITTNLNKLIAAITLCDELLSI